MTRCLHHGERVPERIGYLVYAAAFLLPNGASLGGTIQSVHPDAAPIFTVDETGLTNVLPGALEKIYFFGVGGLAGAVIDALAPNIPWATRSCTPECN